jgi:hypothetical protein
MGPSFLLSPTILEVILPLLEGMMVEHTNLCLCSQQRSAFLFLVGLEFELRASHLQSWCSTAIATVLLVHFCSSYFLEMGVSQTIC